MTDQDRARDADDAFDDESPRVDWQEYYYAVRERLWMPVLCLLLAVLGTTYYLSRQRPAFRARAVLIFEPAPAKVLDKTRAVDDEEVSTPDAINTVVDLLGSFSFARRVAERLKLHKDPRFLATVTHTGVLPMTADDAAGYLLADVSAAYRLKTRLIDLIVTLPNGPLATELANAYADEYLFFALDRRAAANKAANQYLRDEEERLRGQMRVSEAAMQTFRERRRAASPEKLQATSEARLEDLSRAIADTEARLAQVDRDVNAAQQAAAGDFDALLRLPSLAAEPRVAAAAQAVADQERQFALLKQTYRAKHPLYLANETQLAALLRSRNQLLQDSVGLLRGERARLQARRDELRQTQQTQQDQLVADTGTSVEYNDLKRALDTNTAMYNSVLTRVTEIDVTKGMTDLPVQVHERAIGAVPVAVSPVKVYSYSLLLSLAGGIAAALGLHFLDHSIKTIDQVEKLSGLPVLTAVPRKAKGRLRTLDVVTDRQSIVSESFRSLRTSLAMSAEAHERRVFLFTSALPGEGKTFCSTNFSVTLAQQGFRTLLIDADLRKPMVSTVFFGGRRKPGLVEVLGGQASLSEAALATEQENLHVLTTGGQAVNPTELLATQALYDLLRDAPLLFDRVVIDTAPALAVSDSLLIAPLADATCLVVRAFQTPRKTLVRALRSLREINCPPVGVVLNFLPTGGGSYYYYSGKYYGSYGEKSVYGTNAAK